MNNLWFYLWCRWTDHRGATWEERVYEATPGSPSDGEADLYMRVCQRCNRVAVSDVEHILTRIEAVLDRMEAELDEG